MRGERALKIAVKQKRDRMPQAAARAEAQSQSVKDAQARSMIGIRIQTGQPNQADDPDDGLQREVRKNLP